MVASSKGLIVCCAFFSKRGCHISCAKPCNNPSDSSPRANPHLKCAIVLICQHFVINFSVDGHLICTNPTSLKFSPQRQMVYINRCTSREVPDAAESSWSSMAVSGEAPRKMVWSPTVDKHHVITPSSVATGDGKPCIGMEKG